MWSRVIGYEHCGKANLLTSEDRSQNSDSNKTDQHQYCSTTGTACTISQVGNCSKRTRHVAVRRVHLFTSSWVGLILWRSTTVCRSSIQVKDFYFMTRVQCLLVHAVVESIKNVEMHSKSKVYRWLKVSFFIFKYCSTGHMGLETITRWTFGFILLAFNRHLVEYEYWFFLIYNLCNDIGDGTTICRPYQVDLEVLLRTGFANKAKYDSTLDFVYRAAHRDRDRDILRTICRPTMWTVPLELSVADLGDRFRIRVWHGITSTV